MAEKLKDELDINIESMFASEPVIDDGFSARVVSRVRRQMWVRRLTMPVAVLIASIIGANPLLQLLGLTTKLLGSLPLEVLVIDNLPAVELPQISTLIIGAALLGMILMIGRMLEEL